MKKKLFPAIVIMLLFFAGCNKIDFDLFGPKPPPGKSYDAQVATAWLKLQTEISKTTPGFSPGVTGRAFAYTGLTLYESIQPGANGFLSLAPQVAGGLLLPKATNKNKYYWPASANKAMADITRAFYAATTAANKVTIDSLEAAFAAKFQTEARAEEIANAVEFGKTVASSIFDWAKLDGSQNTYPPYVAPVGPGLWVPTPPAFAAPAAPYQGTYRSFVSDIANKAALPPPISYSETQGSAFYNMANEIYTISLSLTAYDSTTVRYWADLPGQYNGPAHFTNVVTQLIVKEKLNLLEAAIVYAKHGIAMNDAGIACWKTKYQYNLLRPITYIRNVLGHGTWNSVIATPPHPEYSSAHAAIMKAGATVLEDIFGKHYEFTDRSFESTYGARHYKSFSEYAAEGAWSRIIGGIHYRQSGDAGLVQGKKVGELVNKLRFR